MSYPEIRRLRLTVILGLTLGLTLFYLTGFAQQTGTFKDPRDGKIYKTVTIGTQTWLAENFAFKPPNSDVQKESNGFRGEYRIHRNKSGKLEFEYEWKTAKKIAPSGWHLPSEKEWKVLIKFLGDDENASAALIKGGSSGFNALLGVNYFTKFWSSTPQTKYFLQSNYGSGSYFARALNVDYIPSGALPIDKKKRENMIKQYRNAKVEDVSQNYHLSVRLLRDN